ncbi:MAG TPA: FxsA family protein [Campylobacterales bacterium]|nr:FxsA family protein [Campylobacterales bacterium]
MILLIPYLFLELYFSLMVGSEIGFLWSVIWIVATFIVGMGLLKNAHLSLMKNMQSVSLGKLNAQSFHDASLSYFLGAILLLIPGVFSDFLGVMALLYTMFLQFGGTIPFIKNKTNIKNSNQQGEMDVIDVEIIEHDTDRNAKP